MEVEAVATEEGFPELALWLRLTRAHHRGEPVAGLELAREQMSARVRDSLAEVTAGDQVHSHRVEAITSDP